MIRKYAAAGLIISVLLVCYGCVMSGSGSRGNVPQVKVLVHEKETSSQWSPDDNHDYKNIFRYYPSKKIYYDIFRGLYFYPKDGKWIASVSIPAELSINIRSFVTLEMDTDKPYQYHDEVQRKFRQDK